jgi:hypothetical protein
MVIGAWWLTGRGVCLWLIRGTRQLSCLTEVMSTPVEGSRFSPHPGMAENPSKVEKLQKNQIIFSTNSSGLLKRLWAWAVLGSGVRGQRCYVANF